MIDPLLSLSYIDIYLDFFLSGSLLQLERTVLSLDMFCMSKNNELESVFLCGRSTTDNHKVARGFGSDLKDLFESISGYLPNYIPTHTTMQTLQVCKNPAHISTHP